MALDEDKGALTLAYADGIYSVLAAVLTASTMGAPMLVIFRDAVNSACGQASSAVGPLYCSGDNHAYLDLSFFQDLRQRFGAPGNFARAYVLAHEIGHHVQNQMGMSEKVAQQRSRSSEVASNALSVRVELQADCFAGVWGY